MSLIQTLSKNAAEAARVLSVIDEADKNEVLFDMAVSLREHTNQIITANLEDLQLANENGLSNAMIDRLTLNQERIEAMAEGLAELKEIRERLKHAKLSDNSSEFNTQRIECLELDNLMETAYATAVAANFRTDSRGAHSREDFLERDDENWLCHSVYDPTTEEMSKRDVNMSPKYREAFPPKARTY